MNQQQPRERSWYIRYPLAVWKYFVGVVFCQFMFGAVVVVGWTSRFMQRQILLSWWNRSKNQADGTFANFAETLAEPCVPRTLPNWSLADSPQPSASHGQVRRTLRRCFGSLYENSRTGLANSLCIFVILLPATSLWYYAWVLGWNISFFKLYEQSALGATLGLFGMALFIVTMLYVPLAHARQALTGRWRSFFDFKRNWKLAWRHPGVMLPVATVFVLASALVMFLRIVPYYAGTDPEFAAMGVEQLRTWLDDYYFVAGAFVLPAYLLVWWGVAKAYSSAALSEYIADPVECPLGETEKGILSQLTFAPQPTASRYLLVRGTTWALGRSAGAAALVLTCLAWFGVGTLVFVAQFFNYLPGAWLNHPLVMLPWIKYIPPGL